MHLIFSHDCMVPHGTPTGNQLFTKACLLDTLWWHCAEQNTFKPYKSYLLPWAVENWKKGVVVKSSYYKISDLKNMIILCIFWINSFLMPLIDSYPWLIFSFPRVHDFLARKARSIDRGFQIFTWALQEKIVNCYKTSVFSSLENYDGIPAVSYSENQLETYHWFKEKKIIHVVKSMFF